MTNEAEGINERVRDEVATRLRDVLGGAAEQVQVDVVGAEATLAGSVDAAETRARAEAVVREVAGVSYVVNNLRVAQEGTTGATG
jgi:osmotically-inducible protein OsmY